LSDHPERPGVRAGETAESRIRNVIKEYIIGCLYARASCFEFNYRAQCTHVHTTYVCTFWIQNRWAQTFPPRRCLMRIEFNSKDYNSTTIRHRQQAIDPITNALP
jgi:hypothetical protein